MCYIMDHLSILAAAPKLILFWSKVHLSNTFNTAGETSQEPVLLSKFASLLKDLIFSQNNLAHIQINVQLISLFSTFPWYDLHYDLHDETLNTDEKNRRISAWLI